jgi:ABC-2 type transport system ATP-binding protein
MAKKKMKTYSGGMKQRVSIAQALLGDPEVLILDEPTVGLDPKERMLFMDYIKSVENRKTIIFSTHVVSDIESISTKLLLLKGASIIYEGSLTEIVATHNALYPNLPNANSLSEVYFQIYD